MEPQFFCVPALEAVKKLSQKQVKILAWISCHASVLIYPFAPVGKGGRGDYRPKVVMEVAATGRSVEEVAETVRGCLNCEVNDIESTRSGYDRFSGERDACPWPSVDV